MKPKTPGQVIKVLKDHIHAYRSCQPEDKHAIACLQRAIAIVRLIFNAQGTLQIPAYTNLSGQVAKLPGYCSSAWKQEPIDRWLRERGVAKNEAVIWIGYGRDEQTRWVRKMAGEDFRRGLVRLPLVHDVPLSRQDCYRVIKEMGWPTPAPKSRCWMCPHQSDSEWRELCRIPMGAARSAHGRWSLPVGPRAGGNPKAHGRPTLVIRRRKATKARRMNTQNPAHLHATGTAAPALSVRTFYPKEKGVHRVGWRFLEPHEGSHDSGEVGPVRPVNL